MMLSGLFLGCMLLFLATLFLVGYYRHKYLGKLKVAALIIIKQLRILIELIPQHRGAANAFLKGDKTFKARLANVGVKVDKEFYRLVALSQDYQEISAQNYSLMVKDWQTIQQNMSTLTAEKSFELHTLLITQILNAMKDVSKEAYLDTNLDHTESQLLSVLVKGLPQLAEILEQARGIGLGVAAQGKINVTHSVRLNYLANRIQHSLEKTLMPLQQLTVLTNRCEHTAKLLNQCTPAVNEFLRCLIQDLLKSSNISIEPDQFYLIGTNAIEKVFALFDASCNLYDTIYKSRSRYVINDILKS